MFGLEKIWREMEKKWKKIKNNFKIDKLILYPSLN